MANDYASEQVEILVIDGSSNDGTRELLAAYSARHPRVRCLDNSKQTTPAALNVGVRHAQGDVIVRMDAHSHYPSDYISSLVYWLEQSGADNVGGVWRTLPADDSPQAQAIAFALAHPFAVGNAHFRIGVVEPQWVDTVPFGCYRRNVFERIGLFDEAFVRNQDDEFNHRLLSQGGRILLVPQITSDYYARSSLRDLWRMYYQYGYFKPLVARKLKRVVTARQLVPPLFVTGLAATLAAAPWTPWTAGMFGVLAVMYITAVTTFAAPAVRSLGIRGAAYLAAAFPVVHLSYGIGFMQGALDFVVRGQNGVRNGAAVPISR